MSEATPPAAMRQSFDDVMLAMDIVDTLRHREFVLASEYGESERREALIGRLREIYHAQGIEVPDRILEDGVEALEDRRFAYDPPKDNSFAVRLAHVYINRRRWAPPLLFIAGATLFLTATYEFGFERPRKAAVERERVEIALTLPAALQKARDEALALADSDAARARVEASYQDGIEAAKSGDPAAMRAAESELQFLSGVLSESLNIRVVSRPGEYSGVFRIPDDAPDARNYYLIVEAVDLSGRARPLEIVSEEDQKTARVEKWGVRVSEATFNAVAADKADDQIIEHAEIGVKSKGALEPSYDIDAGGAILEW